MLGATGSGKTAGGCIPSPTIVGDTGQQTRTFKASALVLEVKGDFCGKLRDPAEESRTDDYIEIGMDSEWAYNPLYNDLEGYALAYGIASY